MFKIDDTVMLKSGSPKLQIIDFGKKSGDLICLYVDKKKEIHYLIASPEEIIPFSNVEVLQG